MEKMSVSQEQMISRFENIREEYVEYGWEYDADVNEGRYYCEYRRSGRDKLRVVSPRFYEAKSWYSELREKISK